MGKVSVAAWARYMTMGSALVMVFGGVMGLFYPLRGIGIYSIIAAAFIYAFEYPVPGIKAVGVVNDVLYIRGVLYICMCAPLLVIVATSAAGFFLFLSGCSYVWAAMRGETWQDPHASGRSEDGGGGGGGRSGGGGGDKKDKEKKADIPAVNPMEMQIHHRPVYDPSQTRYDAQGYAVEDGGYSTAGYDNNGSSASMAPLKPKPKPKPTYGAPPPQSSQPPPQSYDNQGYDGQGYDASGYAE